MAVGLGNSGWELTRCNPDIRTSAHHDTPELFPLVFGHNHSCCLMIVFFFGGGVGGCESGSS